MPRKRLFIRMTPQSPLLLGNRSTLGNFQRTEDYIPGSAVRGAVAQQILAEAGETALADFFSHEEPWFGNAYPGAFGPVWPMPYTARTCKRYPGFPQNSADEDHHGVSDLLLADFAYALVSDVDYPARTQLQPGLADQWSLWQPTIRQGQDRCRHRTPNGTCSHDLVPAPKAGIRYYAWQLAAARPTATLQRRRTTHVGINRARGVAEDELLFTQESLTPGDRQHEAFFAQISVPDEKEQLLRHALTSNTLYVGRGRSRGKGAITAAVWQPAAYEDLRSRLENFALAAQMALQPYQKDVRIAPALPGVLFALTCRSPAILAPFGVPTRTPAPAMLGMPEGVQLIHAWAQMETIGGWHNAARLPRRTQLACSAGSVFLYFAPGMTIQECLPWLQPLEDDGIGAERARGFGEITVCATFHVERNILLR